MNALSFSRMEWARASAALLESKIQVYLWLVGGGKKAFDEGLPFGVECGTTKVSGAFIPIFGVGGLATFAVHVGVNRHAVCGFQLVHEGVSASPVTFCIPPKRGEWRGKAVGGCSCAMDASNSCDSCSTPSYLKLGELVFFCEVL